MAATTNGAAHVDAVMTTQDDPLARYTRWHNAPKAVDVPVDQGADVVELDLSSPEDPTELCALLENERADRRLWITIALSYVRHGSLQWAVDVLQRALHVHARGNTKDRLALLTCMAWIFLLRSRYAPRIPVDKEPDLRTKDHWLREATNAINEAMRVSPDHAPLFLTRGVLGLLRATLATSTQTGQAAENARNDALVQAGRAFEDAVRLSQGNNLLALIGKARVLYMQKRFAQALQIYQQVLVKMPDLTDPDPRIGIGACMWQMGHYEQARGAWERALNLNPVSTAANSLLSVYWFRESSKKTGSERVNDYAKALKFVVTSNNISKKLNRSNAFASASLSSHFLTQEAHDKVDLTASKAIEQTDINAIASDSWFSKAVAAHAEKNLVTAAEAYSKADQARGGQGGYFPANFALAQITLEASDQQGAKYKLEKLFEKYKTVEVMSLLGGIYADEVFTALKTNPKEDKTQEIRKAIRMLESARRLWKDPKTKLYNKPDPVVIIYLSRLYEVEQPTEAQKCLNEVEALEREQVANDNNFDPSSPEFLDQLKEQMPPQLHNNIGCFNYRDELYEQALSRFETGLTATQKLYEKQQEEETVHLEDTVALLTTITYNLARTQEALGMLAEATQTYERVLGRRPDYTDASARRAYVTLQSDPKEAGPKMINAVYQSDHSHMEVRALMGWYFHLSKKRTNNLSEDQEHRHYKHTLMNYDKHDLYSLVGMGNLHLTLARDMPRNNEQEKEKRTRMYQKAYEFFDKALQLDPRNAYAAQGVAVALCDDKKAYSEALQILIKVKDTVRDVSVHQNLGHVNCELKQYGRSIDNYETALKKQIDTRDKLRESLAKVDSKVNGNHVNGDSKDGSIHPADAPLHTLLSRSWLQKGKTDRSILALNTSLHHMRLALSTTPASPHLRFNVAFIQFQIVTTLNGLSDGERTLEDLKAAKIGLEEAISTFEELAQSSNPPYPKSILDSRASMCKGTLTKQLDRSTSNQEAYERANKDKIDAAKLRRAEQIREQEAKAERRLAEEQAREDEIRAKREADQAVAAEQAEKFRQQRLIEEEKDMTTDDEGNRIKRVKKSKKGGKKRKAEDEDGFIENDDEESGAEYEGKKRRERTPLSDLDAAAGTGSDAKPKTKKRRLQSKGGGEKTRKEKARTAKEPRGKYLSQAVIVDSDESDADDSAKASPQPRRKEEESEGEEREDRDANGDTDMLDHQPGVDDGEDEDEDMPVQVARSRQRKNIRTIEDDDEDEDGEGAEAGLAMNGRVSGNVDEEE